MRNKNKSSVYLVLTGIVVFSMIGLIAFHKAAPAQASVPAASSKTDTSASDKKGSGITVIEVTKDISAEIIEDSLRDMGALATEEYFFKEVVSYQSIKKFLNINVPFTESSYLASYEGTVRAGINFTKITVSKDDATSVITVSLPKAQILSIDIDTDSFELYSEKEGLGNPVSIRDYNNSLSELKTTAKESAIDRGVLTKADENARNVIRNFILSLPCDTVYTLQFVTAE